MKRLVPVLSTLGFLLLPSSVLAQRPVCELPSDLEEDGFSLTFWDLLWDLDHVVARWGSQGVLFPACLPPDPQHGDDATLFDVIMKINNQALKGASDELWLMTYAADVSDLSAKKRVKYVDSKLTRTFRGMVVCKVDKDPDLEDRFVVEFIRRPTAGEFPDRKSCRIAP